MRLAPPPLSFFFCSSTSTLSLDIEIVRERSSFDQGEKKLPEVSTTFRVNEKLYLFDVDKEASSTQIKEKIRKKKANFKPKKWTPTNGHPRPRPRSLLRRYGWVLNVVVTYLRRGRESEAPRSARRERLHSKRHSGIADERDDEKTKGSSGEARHLFFLPCNSHRQP